MNPRSQAGITMLELLVVMAVVAILAAIAYPSYVNQIQQTRRAEAVAALTELANRQERFYTVNFRYAGTVAVLSYPVTTEKGYYTVSIPTVTSTGYTVRATAQGTQADDTACTPMNLTSEGARTPAQCWE